MAIISAGHTTCALSDKVLQAGDWIVCFPHFIEKDDPLWIYSDSCMLRDAFDAWKYHDEFLARLADFWRITLANNPYWQAVVDNKDYLIHFGTVVTSIVIRFLKHGFIIAFRAGEWPDVRHAFLSTQQGEARCETRDGTVRLRKMPEESGVLVLGGAGLVYAPAEVQIEIAPRSPGRLIPCDRILISSEEWLSLTESLREVDRFLANQASF